MPTSSQALILHKPAVRTESVLRTQSLMIKEPASCAVASIYNLSGCVPLSKTTVNDGNAVKVLGRESAQLFKYHELPRGYTSILAYDDSRESFDWQVLGGGLEHKTIDGEIKHHSNDQLRRPASAVEFRQRDNNKGQVKVVNETMFERLVGLGFRRSEFAIIGEDGKERPAPKSTDIVTVPAIGSGRSERPQQPPGKPTSESPASIPKPEPNTRKVEIRETPSICDVIPDDIHFQFDEEYNRIKPSVYMVKHTPKSRPTAAILSLRENECSFHAEVKFLIETQIGVRVKSIQYDPLHIRSGKPDVRSRWIVDFNTTDDLEKVVRKGLVVGKDKIIIFKFDDIMKREVSSFRYFKAVLDAKKKLKGSKLHNSSTKGKTTTGKCENPLKTTVSVQ